MPPRIKLVTFDALHTLITPRLPIAVQYAQTFEPYLGPLDPKLLNSSFKRALKDLQKSKPLYASPSSSPSAASTSDPASQNPDPTSWWTEIIRRTALGAHASPALVSAHLESIVPVLMKRFRSDEGYMLFDDVVPSLQELKSMGVKTGIITNADSRILQVLSCLYLPTHLSSFPSPSTSPPPTPVPTPTTAKAQDKGPALPQPLILVSELLGIEKPSPRIFERACELAGVKLGEGLHVGDEVNADYLGARHSSSSSSSPKSTGLGGMHALLLLRPTHDRPTQRSDEELSQLVERGVRREDVISELEEVVRRVSEVNGNGS